MQASSAGLDVQLKILQALPSLLQNYSADIKGDLLVTALNICFTLQSSKNAIVNHTSAATLQQLVVSVFDKVVAEDSTWSERPSLGSTFTDRRAENASDGSYAGVAPTSDGEVELRAAALDAYRVCCAAMALMYGAMADLGRYSTTCVFSRKTSGPNLFDLPASRRLSGWS